MKNFQKMVVGCLFLVFALSSFRFIAPDLLFASTSGSEVRFRTQVSRNYSDSVIPAELHEVRDTSNIMKGINPKNGGESPVVIDGNDALAAGADAGSGTENDPYEIVGHIFDANSNGSALFLANITAHCHIHNNTFRQSGNSPHAGIHLVNVTHATLRANIVLENAFGIKIEKSSDISVAHNLIKDNGDYGCLITDSHQILVLNNTITYNYKAGIRCEASNFVTIQKTVSFDNYGSGIILDHTNHSILENNRVFDNPWMHGVSHWFYEIGAAICVRYSINTTLYENYATDDYNPGIALNNVHRSNLTLNHASDYDITNSTNNIVAKNDFVEPLVISMMSFYKSPNNLILNNNLADCGIRFAGQFLKDATQTQVEGNLVNGKPVLFLQNSTFRLFSGLHQAAGQIIIINSSHLELLDYELTHTTVNMQILFSRNISLYNSTIGNSFFGGIDISFSDHVSIVNNTFLNSSDGVNLYQTSDSVLQRNVFLNTGNGVSFRNSHNNILSRNDFYPVWRGIKLKNAETNLIHANKIYDAQLYGIECYNGHNNNITQNCIVNCSEFGIYLRESSNNTIYMNAFLNNTAHAYSDSSNLWSFGDAGNYWDDYTGSDNNRDGIGDSPYEITGAGKNEDGFPLMTEAQIWDPFPPTRGISSFPPVFFILFTIGSISWMLFALQRTSKSKKVR